MTRLCNRAGSRGTKQGKVERPQPRRSASAPPLLREPPPPDSGLPCPRAADMPEVAPVFFCVLNVSTSIAKLLVRFVACILQMLILVSRQFTRSNKAFQVCTSIGLLAWLVPKLFSYCANNFKSVDVDGYP